MIHVASLYILRFLGVSVIIFFGNGSSMVVVTYNVAVYNEVPPHPCPSDDTNQRHTRVRNHVGVVAFFGSWKNLS